MKFKDQDVGGKLISILVIPLMFIIPFIILANFGFMAMITYFYCLFTIPLGIAAIIKLVKIIINRDFKNDKFPYLILAAIFGIFAAVGSFFRDTQMIAGILLLGLPILLWISVFED
mgnify:CR=1 FL=1